MKKSISMSILLLTIYVFFGCKKTEPATMPVLSTTPVTNITASTATSGGNITSDGRATITVSGVCWSTTANPTTSDSKTTDGTATGQFVSEITGLTAGLTFHVRAYATNSVGTAYGADMSSSTLGQPPSCITQPETNVSATGATLNGTVDANDLSTTVTFEYGLTTSYGSTVTVTQSPITGNTITNVSADIAGMTAGTIYHFRIKAVNSLGTTFGIDVTFTTYSVTVVDVDGNVYNTVTIGTQVWMAENLKTTKYLNGDLIGTTTPATLDILAEATPKYQWAYDGNESNVNTYGRLYTWYAITDTRKVCPVGWHVPTDSERTTLTTSLGGGNIAGGKLKEAGTSHWMPPNGGVTNSSGFTALPSGARDVASSFVNIGYIGYWWSSTEYVSTDAWDWHMTYDNSYVSSVYIDKRNGLAVRCLRD